MAKCKALTGLVVKGLSKETLRDSIKQSCQVQRPGEMSSKSNHSTSTRT